MASLLPVEIWDRIVSWLPHQYDGVDHLKCYWNSECRDTEKANSLTLSNLSIVNKTLFAVVRRHMSHQVMTFPDGPRRNLRKFLINVLKKPYLGSKLKVIYFQGQGGDWDDCQYIHQVYVGQVYEPVPPDYYDSPNITRLETEAVIMQRARDFAGIRFPSGVADAVPFDKHIKLRCTTAQIVLLLCSAPNLEVLNLTPVNNDKCSQALSLIQTANVPNLRPPLSKLHTLVLAGDDPFIELDEWTFLTRIPSLRRLHLHSPSGHLGDEVLSIEELHLMNSYQYSEDMYRVFRACQNLRHLKMSHEPTFILDGAQETPYQGLEHLRQCRDALETVDWPSGIHFRRQLVELASFVKLRAATVAICALFNDGDIPCDQWDDSTDPYMRGYKVERQSLRGCFPPSIEEITFYSCARCVAPPDPLPRENPPFSCGHLQHSKIHALCAFAEAAAGRLVQLKKVTYLHNFPELSDDVLADLSHAFSAIGVQFEAHAGDRYEIVDEFDVLTLVV
jgi:hypothetical protein